MSNRKRKLRRRRHQRRQAVLRNAAAPMISNDTMLGGSGRLDAAATPAPLLMPPPTQERRYVVTWLVETGLALPASMKWFDRREDAESCAKQNNGIVVDLEFVEKQQARYCRDPDLLYDSQILRQRAGRPLGRRSTYHDETLVRGY